MGDPIFKCSVIRRGGGAEVRFVCGDSVHFARVEDADVFVKANGLSPVRREALTALRKEVRLPATGLAPLFKDSRNTPGDIAMSQRVARLQAALGRTATRTSRDWWMRQSRLCTTRQNEQMLAMLLSVRARHGGEADWLDLLREAMAHDAYSSITSLRSRVEAELRKRRKEDDHV